MIQNKKNNYIYFIFFLLILFDQYTKYTVETNLIIYDSIQITSFMNLTFIVNYGFAFGFLNSPALNQIFVILILSLIIIYLFYLLKNTFKNSFSKFGLILIISGALGNLIDRFYRGYVIDFIDLFYKNYHWPVFNFADTYITIGFIFMIYSITKEKHF